VASVELANIGMAFRSPAGTVTALNGTSLTVEHGEFVALLGPSGCGKSTLLRIISGLLAPTAGGVRVLDGTPAEARGSRRIGFVFQQAALMPWRSVLGNVSLPLEVGPAEARRAKGMEPAEALELVGLSDFHGHYPHQLSGGMQQRVSIARALVTAPDVLLMDEPFGALDEITREHLNDQLLELWHSTGMTVVFVTHSIPEAAYLASRVAVMAARPGRIIDVVELATRYPRGEAYRHSEELAANSRRLRSVLDAA
jgi:NitT/TauT family transport system ATP-binding protein